MWDPSSKQMCCTMLGSLQCLAGSPSDCGRTGCFLTNALPIFVPLHWAEIEEIFEDLGACKATDTFLPLYQEPMAWRYVLPWACCAASTPPAFPNRDQCTFRFSRGSPRCTNSLHDWHHFYQKDTANKMKQSGLHIWLQNMVRWLVNKYSG